MVNGRTCVCSYPDTFDDIVVENIGTRNTFWEIHTMNPIKRKTHHPQHQMTITHAQVFKIVREHGPVSHADIVTYAGALKHNLPVKAWKNAYRAPVVTLPSGATEPILFAPMEQKISGYLRALSRSGSIQRSDSPPGSGKKRISLWSTRLTIAHAIEFLNDAGFAYVIVSKVHKRSSAGLGKNFVTWIEAEIREELKRVEGKEVT